MTKPKIIRWEDIHDAQYDAGRVIQLLGNPPQGKKGYDVFERDEEGTWLYQVYCGNIMIESQGENNYCARYDFLPDNPNENSYLTATETTAEEAIDTLRYMLSERYTWISYDLDTLGGPYPNPWAQE